MDDLKNIMDKYNDTSKVHVNKCKREADTTGRPLFNNGTYQAYVSTAYTRGQVAKPVTSLDIEINKLREVVSDVVDDKLTEKYNNALEIIKMQAERIKMQIDRINTLEKLNKSSDIKDLLDAVLALKEENIELKKDIEVLKIQQGIYGYTRSSGSAETFVPQIAYPIQGQGTISNAVVTSQPTMIDLNKYCYSDNTSSTNTNNTNTTTTI